MIAAQTVAVHPDLFKIVTPINVRRFEELLDGHPNPSFVLSVCRALREGFWPWADTSDAAYPSINDNSMHTGTKTDSQQRFIHDQLDEEIRLGRFSQSFGPHLLPGMYSVPIHTVPKPHSDKLRLIVDHTAGDFSLNSMIDHDDIKGLKLDGLHSLGASLLAYRRDHPSADLVMFKSDVSQAFRRLPMHPWWQVKQIITVDGQRYVDRNNDFGGRGSPKVWISFMCLVAWIAIHKFLIDALKTYMDDSFSFDEAAHMRCYAPYGRAFPDKQCRLLELWDELSLPHDESKQVYGRTLTVIGFEVDPNAMQVTLPSDKKHELVAQLRSFIGKNFRWSLRDFQRLAGWCEWSFNVFPLLKPGLSALYDKIKGKQQAFARLRLNNSIIRELSWLADNIERSDGLLLFKSLDFKPTDDDVVVAYTDASSAGLGIWIPHDNFACQCPLPTSPPNDTIFFFEALAVCSAIHCVADMAWTPAKLLVYSDNMNTVAIFNSLRAGPSYNPILLSAVDILLKYRFDLRVEHVPGPENVIADSLSRFQNERVLLHAPDVDICTFEPPRDALGAVKK